MLREGEHFGLLVKEKIPIAIFLEYRDDNVLEAVKFRAGQDLVGDLHEMFDRQWERLGPAQDLVTLKKRGAF